MRACNETTLPLADAIFAWRLNGGGGIQPIDCDDQVKTPIWLHLDPRAPQSQQWLKSTPLLSDAAREVLIGESLRPRVSRLGEGVLLVLRSISMHHAGAPERLTAIRIFLHAQCIISTSHYPAQALKEVDGCLQRGEGPVSVTDWLVAICDRLTEHVSEVLEYFQDEVVSLEDALLELQRPSQGKLALLRKQLVIVRRYMVPQRDVFSRLASESICSMDAAGRRSMQEISDRLGRGLDDLNACLARTAIIADEITTLVAEAMNRRTYTMSLLAMIFLPATFLTGLFGVNLGGIPGGGWRYGFAFFCLLLLAIALLIIYWLKRRRWL